MVYNVMVQFGVVSQLGAGAPGAGEVRILDIIKQWALEFECEGPTHRRVCRLPYFEDGR